MEKAAVQNMRNQLVRYLLVRPDNSSVIKKPKRQRGLVSLFFADQDSPNNLTQAGSMNLNR